MAERKKAGNASMESVSQRVWRVWHCRGQTGSTNSCGSEGLLDELCSGIYQAASHIVAV